MTLRWKPINHFWLEIIIFAVCFMSNFPNIIDKLACILVHQMYKYGCYIGNSLISLLHFDGLARINCNKLLMHTVLREKYALTYCKPFGKCQYSIYTLVYCFVLLKLYPLSCSSMPKYAIIITLVLKAKQYWRFTK